MTEQTIEESANKRCQYMIFIGGREGFRPCNAEATGHLELCYYHLMMRISKETVQMTGQQTDLMSAIQKIKEVAWSVHPDNPVNKERNERLNEGLKRLHNAIHRATRI